MPESFDPLSDLEEDRRPPAAQPAGGPQPVHRQPTVESTARPPGEPAPAARPGGAPGRNPQLRRASAQQYWLKLVERRRAEEASDRQSAILLWRHHSAWLMLLLGFVTTTILALDVYERQRENNWDTIRAHVNRKDSRERWFSSKKTYTINISYVAKYLDFQPGVRVSKREWDRYSVGDPIQIQIDPDEPVRWKFPGAYSSLVRLYDKVAALLIVGLIFCGALILWSYRRMLRAEK